MQVIWMPIASQALDNAINYIEEKNPYAARNQVNEIMHQIELFEDNPEMGRVGREQGTRELVINRTSFILVYCIEKNNIYIVQFLHGAQQWPKN